MDGIVGLVAGSGWASGVNLYAVVALLNLLGRAGLGEVPDALLRTDVLVVAIVLYVAEFVADKIPYVDNLWDVAHTVIRPLGAAGLGALLSGDAETLGQAVAAVGSGGLALASHTAKATARAAINTSPEPASNVVVSLLEDGLVAGVVVLALRAPWVALGAVVVLLVAGIALTLGLWRAARAAITRRRERRRSRLG